MKFEIKAAKFTHESDIPSRFTCEGENLSPELHWSGAPAGTKTFVLIVDDPDAPDPAAPKTTFVHWVVYDIPASVSRLAEGAGSNQSPGDGTSGITDYNILTYKGPCPPIGRHRYFFKLYAVDKVLELAPGRKKAEVLKAIESHVLSDTHIMGKYKKSR